MQLAMDMSLRTRGAEGVSMSSMHNTEHATRQDQYCPSTMGSLYTHKHATKPDTRGFAHIDTKYRFREHFAKYATLWNRAVLIFSLISAGVYVLETYLEQSETPLWSYFIETSIAFFFSADYGLQFYLCDNRVEYVLKITSVLDILCILPVFFTYALAGQESRAQQFIFFLQFLRVARLIRVLRGYRAVSVSKRGNPDNLRKQINVLAYTVMALIFITAALLHLVEKYGSLAFVGDEADNPQLVHFHDAIYFVVITLTTVGYGDISPKTTIGRFLVMIFVTCSFIIIPRETGKLSELFALTSQYAGGFVPKGQEDSTHVIVCGHLDFNNLRSFLMEFFHQAHGQHKMTVLLLSPSPPTKAVKLLFGRNGLYGERVIFFEGSALDEDDLQRLKFPKACAIFFLADKQSSDVHASDSETIMRILSCKNVCRQVPVFAQILLQETKNQAIIAGADYIVCLRELKMHILAASSLVRGFSTLFCNLFRNEDFVYDKEGHWLEEYCHGISYEVYTFEFPPAFHGRSFAEVSYFIFKEWQSLLFGVQRVDPVTKQINAYLNPVGSSDFIIGPGDSGFVFATDSEVTDMIAQFDGDLVTASATGLFKCSAIDHAQQDSDGAGFTDIGLSLDEKDCESDNSDSSTPFNLYPKVHTADLPPLVPLTHYSEERGSQDIPTQIKQRIKTSVPDETSGHIVLVCSQLTMFFHFISQIRTDPMRSKTPIFGLIPKLPPKSRLEQLLQYEEVYIMVGSGKDRGEIIRCGLPRARSFVILAGSKRDPFFDGDQVAEEMMTDFDVVTVYHTYQNACPAESMPFTIAELSQKQNLRYFPPEHDQRLCHITEQNDYIAPPYAAGNVYSDAVMDSLLCQVFYNTELLRVLGLFLGSREQTNPGDSSGMHTTSRFHLTPLRVEFIGWTFERLLSHLLLGKMKILPIGLYRAPRGAMSSLASYVHLCPQPEALLREGDYIYAFAEKDPALYFEQMGGASQDAGGGGGGGGGGGNRTQGKEGNPLAGRNQSASGLKAARKARDNEEEARKQRLSGKS